MKQLNDVELCMKNLLTFIIPKNYGSLARVISLKVAINMSDPTRLFRDSLTLNYLFFFAPDDMQILLNDFIFAV